MKIFVTGAAGFIGRATIEMGREQGHTMTGCDVDDSDVEGVIAGSITDPDMLIRETAGCDAIVHLGAVYTSHIEQGMSNAEFYAINVIGTDNVFQAALANKIPRVVYASSVDVHCGTHCDWAFSGALKYTERTPDMPNSLYALTKLMNEKAGHYYYDTHGIKFCALRYVYIWQSCTAPEDIPPVGLISRITVREDCADANLRACTAANVENDVLLIGPDNRMSNQDIVRSITALEEVVDKYWPGSVDLLKEAGFKIKGKLWPACDITRARQVLGWSPRYDFDWLLGLVQNEGLRRLQ